MKRCGIFPIDLRKVLTVITLNRKVTVTAAEDNEGFYSAIKLLSASTAKWQDASALLPGIHYGMSGGPSPHGRRALSA